MPNEIKYDCARASAFLSLELMQSSPGASEESLLEKLTEIALLTIVESERRLKQERQAKGKRATLLCPHCFHRYHTHEANRGKYCLCPACGQTMRAPEKVGRN